MNLCAQACIFPLTTTVECRIAFGGGGRGGVSAWVSSKAGLCSEMVHCRAVQQNSMYSPPPFAIPQTKAKRNPSLQIM